MRRLPFGGKATFVYEGGALRTTSLTYGGTTYTPGDAAADQEVRDGLASNRWVGWKKAEVSLIASLLAETNLVLHVKLVHLELAAAFQAVALKAFTAEPDHPFRRLLDPFIHRSIQVTNPNLDLLFDPTQKAAQFTLAPLLLDEQLKLLTDNIRDHPVGIKGLHMREWAAERGMGSFSAANATAAAGELAPDATGSGGRRRHEALRRADQEEIGRRRHRGDARQRSQLPLYPRPLRCRPTLHARAPRLVTPRR